MTPLNPEPRLEKNYILALVLSLGVMLAYPFILQQFYPTQKNGEEVIETTPEEKLQRETEEVFLTAKKPMPAIQAEPEKILFENEIYEVRFSTLGGSLEQLIYKGDAGRQAVTRNVLFDGAPYEPGLFSVTLAGESVDLSRANFRLVSEPTSRDRAAFEFEKEGEYRITKEFIISRSEPIMSLDVTIENLSETVRHFPLEIAAGLHSDPLVRKQNPHEFSVVAWNGKTVASDMKHVSKKGFTVSENVSWAGVIKKYFVVLMKPDWKPVAAEGVAEDPVLWTRLKMEPITLAAASSVTKEIFIYAGPQRYEMLASFQVGFENTLSHGFFGPLKILFLKALKMSHQITHNFGWDIILLTIIIKVLFAPLTHMSYNSMEKMKAIQPKLKSIQERHKNDPARLNKEMMELYKRNRVNPMGGCLPMVLQIPIFIAFYQVLNEAIELRGAPFIGWIQDLSEPDRLFTFPFSLPLLGDGFNVLPLLMIASMVIQQKMTPQTGVAPEQQKIFALMPIIFGFIFYSMPSGLVLYWFVNNVLSIAQQGLVRRVKIVLHHDDADHAH